MSNASGPAIPIPCRSCGKSVMSFVPTQGTSELLCTECGQATRVRADLEGDRWQVRTEATPPKQTRGPGSTQTSLQEPDWSPALRELVLSRPSARRTVRKDSGSGKRLTPAQKSSLRRDLLRLRKAGRPVPRILATVGKKYRITLAAVRWHLNLLESSRSSVSGGAPPPRALRGASRSGGPGAEPTPLRPRGRARMLGALEASRSERALKRFLRARRLHSRLKTARLRLKTLRGAVRKAESMLEGLEEQYRRILRG